MASVVSLVNSGALKSALADALVGKLGAALEQLDRGNTEAAVSQFEAFINQVTGLANAGKLSSAQAQSLIASADQIIRHL